MEVPPPKRKRGSGGPAGANHFKYDPDLPHSDVPGVLWHQKSRKWRGSVRNVLTKKYDCTRYFPADQQRECEDATKEVRENMKSEYWRTRSELAKADPLTKDLELCPTDPEDAEVGKVYWRPNQQDGHKPVRMVRSGNPNSKIGVHWVLACQVNDCCNVATTHRMKGMPRIHCIAHLTTEERCPHNQLWTKCRECNPKITKSSSHCSNCGSQLSVKRRESNGGNGYCLPCEKHMTNEAAENGGEVPMKGDSWEVHCLNKLKELVPHAYEMQDDMRNMLGSSKRVRRGQCDTDKQRRPDLLYVLRDEKTARIVCVISVEIDEHSHSHDNYTSDCEVGKVDETFQSVCKLGQREGFTDDRAGVARADIHHPVYYVFKLNPNSCDVKPTIKLDRRIQVLADRVNALFARPRTDFKDMIERGEAHVPIVECMYYHSKYGKHHLDYFKERAGDTGAWSWLGNFVGP